MPNAPNEFRLIDSFSIICHFDRMGDKMTKKLVGIADANDLTTEENVAKFTRNLEAVMLKNQFDNDPNMILTCVGHFSADGKDNTSDEDIRRQIESHISEVTAGLRAAEAENHKDK